MAVDINTSISDLVTSLDASTVAIVAATAAFTEGVVSIVDGLGSIDCSVCPPTGTYPPTDGIVEGDPPPTGFDDYDVGVVDRKCKLANMYFDDFREATYLLNVNGIDDLGALAIGSMTALLGMILGMLASGPIGWGLGALGAIAGLIAYFLIESVDLLSLIGILDANREELVCSLYEATTPEVGKDAFKAILAANGADAAQLAYIDVVNMTVALEVLFFKPDGTYGDDIEARLDGFVAFIDCEDCLQPSAPGFYYDTSSSSPFNVIEYGARDDPPAWSQSGSDVFEDADGWNTDTVRGGTGYQWLYFYIKNPVFGHPEWGNGANDVYWSLTRLSFTIQNMATIPAFTGMDGGLNTVTRGPGFSSGAYRANTSGSPEFTSWETMQLGLGPTAEWFTLHFRMYYDANYNNAFKGSIRDIHLATLDLPAPWEV